MSVSDEPDAGNRVLMDEHRFVDVTKLHAPDFKVFVCRTCREQVAIRADVK